MQLTKVFSVHFGYGFCVQSLRCNSWIKFQSYIARDLWCFPRQNSCRRGRSCCYLNSKLRDDTVLNLKALFVLVSKTMAQKWLEPCWIGSTVGYWPSNICVLYGLRETDNTKCIPPSIKPSYKTKSQPVEGRAVEKQVEKHPCYGCGMLGHKKVTCRFDKSEYFNLVNTS